MTINYLILFSIKILFFIYYLLLLNIYYKPYPMFSTGNIIVTSIAVSLSMIFIMISAWYVKKLFVSETKDLLVRFILIVFGSLVGVFIVDKVVAFKIPLLSVSQNENLFDLIKTLILMIFSYYFGTQKGADRKEE